MLSRELTCTDCGWRTVCGPDDIAMRLRLIGLLRRDKNPDESILAELLAQSSSRMTCPACKRIGLKAGEPSTDENEEDWQAAVLCEICRQAIAPERLEVFPDSKRCVSCQGKAETGTLPDDDPEFCPRCGALVEIRVSRGSGLTRYKRFCTGGCRL